MFSGSTKIYLYVIPLLDTATTSCLPWMKLLWTFIATSLCGYLFSLLLGKFPEAELRGYRVTSKMASKVGLAFYNPSSSTRRKVFTVPYSDLCLAWPLFKTTHSSWYTVIFNYGLICIITLIANVHTVIQLMTICITTCEECSNARLILIGPSIFLLN